MSFSYISKDPEIIDLKHPAGSLEMGIPSEGARLFSITYTPQGEGPHPTILLLHGFPGYERNFDLAQIFRRAGFNTMVFHYRGSWGSEGSYSFAHVLEDTKNVIRFLLDEENCKKYSMDPSKFVLMGHSVGGFSALMNGSELPEVRHVVAMAAYNLGAVAKHRRIDEDYAELSRGMFVDCSLPLKGTDYGTLLDEIDRNADEWDVCNHASGFKGKDLLVISGARDEVSHPQIHHYPFMRALEGAGVSTASEVIIDESHSFHSRRIELAETILAWLQEKALLPG